MPSPEFLRPVLATFDYELEVELGPPAICRAKGDDGEVWEATAPTVDEAMDKLVSLLAGRSADEIKLVADLAAVVLHRKQR